MPELSNNALAEFSAKVHTVYDQVVGEERLNDAVGDGYSIRRIMSCKYIKYVHGEKMLADSKFTLFVKYDKDGNELDATIYGVNGHPAPTNQPKPEAVEPVKTNIRKLSEYMAARPDVESWRFISGADVGGPPAARIEYTSGGVSKTVIIIKDGPGVENIFEVPG